ncbi:hypothetical protein TGME49_256700 [Toxoplasma gondii ME49]|uniref:Transmembrane protein n=1 Tax=Toxoplasma gondii (strain ATCC 50611 / Me49) TaxID=508771 RepID=S8F3H3_TOXGM|nr:hypothetical protein TGME49_256700 [Toxoplasma gondii ME49]EPT29207.1 hypothetical protein TGME49_256700 [Toxoplasma gondii ME49]|eukprot:XP_018636952.1 hypothetical protein TGME49_256700 [Toxoplasma gondii ME49]
MRRHHAPWRVLVLCLSFSVQRLPTMAVDCIPAVVILSWYFSALAASTSETTAGDDEALPSTSQASGRIASSPRSPDTDSPLSGDARSDSKGDGGVQSQEEARRELDQIMTKVNRLQSAKYVERLIVDHKRNRWATLDSYLRMQRKGGAASMTPEEVAMFSERYEELRGAKQQEIGERRAKLSELTMEIKHLKLKMRTILRRVPELRRVVDFRRRQWLPTDPGNPGDVGLSGMSTPVTGSGTLPETREELEDLVTQQRRVVKNYLTLTAQRRKRLRKMIQHKEGLLQEQSASASEKPDEGMKNQAAELQAAESDQRRMEADVSNAEELLRSAREVLKTYQQKLREMKRRPQRRRNPLRSVKRSPLITGPSVTAEAQSTSDTNVSDAGEGGSNAGSTGITGNVRGDVRTAPQRGASEGRLASDTSAATPTPREPRPSQSGRRKRKGQGERDVPLTGILLKGNGTRCHSGRAPVDGLGFSGVKSEHTC